MKHDCIACGVHRVCVLIEISAPADDGVHQWAEPAGRVCICRECLLDPLKKMTTITCLVESL